MHTSGMDRVPWGGLSRSAKRGLKPNCSARPALFWSSCASFSFRPPMSSSVDAGCVCIICYASVPPPIQSGCACRSDSGLAHVDCLIAKAVSQLAHRGTKVWWECQTCEQCFTGAMRTGLGEAWWSRVCEQAEESKERLAAANNLAECRRCDGQYAEAEGIEREVLGVTRRVLGEEHPQTLTSAGNLASRYAEECGQSSTVALGPREVR